jgi:protein-disulfide isomerase
MSDVSDAPKPKKKKKKASAAGAADKTRPMGAPKAAARPVSPKDRRPRPRVDREPKGELPWFLWVVAAVMVAGVVAMVAFGRSAPQAEVAQPDTAAVGAAPSGPDAKAIVAVFGDDPILGKASAPVTIVVFSDFQCPFCARVEPTLAQLREEYGDKIRIVWKDVPLPFHDRAIPAASAAHAVFLARGNGAFWKMHDAIFRGQSDLSDSALVARAEEAGATAADIQRGKEQAAAKVQSSLELGHRLGINGTPNCLIDGESIVGAESIDKFRSVIEAHLTKAAELKASGTSDAELYTAMVKTYYKVPTPDAEEEEEDESLAPPKVVPIGDSPARGPANAPITLVVFSDFECPFCKKLEPTLERIRKDYPGKVRFVYKHSPLPFHKRAAPAAELAMTAREQRGDAGFWAAHDAIFRLNSLEDEALEATARDLGLDGAAVLAAIRSEKHRAIIERDTKLGADLGVDGVPHTFVNGRALSGAYPYEKYKSVIDEELAKAR